MNLVALGLGYCARHFVETRGLAASTFGTSRDRAQVEALTAAGLRAGFCDGGTCDPQVCAALREAEALLVSAAPDSAGDPILTAFGPDLEASGRLKIVVYLSTVGVYGDHQGRWIDEDAPLHGKSPRILARKAAEDSWFAFGARTGAAVASLRLAGIYGPGRNALVAVAQGKARRIVKQDQVFNRIHVEDVAGAIEAALDAQRSGVWNVADDEPTDQPTPIAFAAALLGSPPPPEIAFEAAEFTPMARSFWGESKRVSNRRIKQELGLRLAYPTYREGLRALFEAGEGGG